MYERNGVKYGVTEQEQTGTQEEQPWSRKNETQNMQRTYAGMNINRREKEQSAEQIYSELDEHMKKALCFHEQLADYFCFLGLQGQT